jgi:sirohydrochlorin ferrochelatase
VTQTLLAPGIKGPAFAGPGFAAPVVLAAHGSRDPRSAATIASLADRIGALWPAPVTPAFLDFDQPSIPDTLRTHAFLSETGRSPIVVPALLTSAFHNRVDLPAVLAGVAVPTRVSPVLGPSAPGEAPDPRLVAGLRRRLSELDIPFDGLVLLAAGTSHAAARSTVDAVANAISAELDVACLVGYASASAPNGGEAVRAVRALGASRILAASYFLAPGRLYEAAAASALEAGALGVARPLGAADELVRLVFARIAAAAATG